MTDLQLNPAGTGMSFHKLDRAKDDSYWSVRVSYDIRPRKKVLPK